MTKLAELLPKKKSLGSLLMTQSKAPIDFSKVTLKKPVPKPSLGELSQAVETGFGAITEAPQRLLAEFLMNLPAKTFRVGNTEIKFDPKGAREIAEKPIQDFSGFQGKSQVEEAISKSGIPGAKQAAPFLGFAGSILEPLGPLGKVGKTAEAVIGFLKTSKFGKIALRVGEKATKKSSGFGQAKIAERLSLSDEETARLLDTLPVKSETGNRIVLEDDNFRAIVSKDWLGQKTEPWLMNLIPKKPVRGAGVEPTTSVVSGLRSAAELPAQAKPSTIPLVTQATTKATEQVAGVTGLGVKTSEALPPVSLEAGAARVVEEATPIGTQKLSQTGALVEDIARSDAFLNLNRLGIGENAAKKLVEAIEAIRPELEATRGKSLTHEEVLKAAVDSSLLTKATSREATLKSEAALLATRQNLAAMSEGKGITKDFVDQLRIVSAEATRRGRELNALGISADPILNTSKADLVKKLIDLGIETDKIVKAAEKVDFNDLQQVTNFYRQFVPPSWTELIDEYRYINLLSSPRTHIVNTFSNLLQTTLLNPATRLASGAVDFVLAALTGREREIYMKEVLPYARGVLNAFPRAVSSFLDALKGKIRIERPDIPRISTGAKLFKPFQVIPRMLEASDVLFRTLIEEGERQALAMRFAKQGKELTAKALSEIDEVAKEKAAYYVFRAPLDASNKGGQGKLLSAIDKLTSVVYQLRGVPGVKWFVPFVQTPMNIFKQGIEFSPLGLATLPGATNKTEQLGKTIIGSSVFLGAAALGLHGRLTWSAPTSAKEKEAFYNSGRQPYSVRLGDNWVSFSKLGPLAYPMAIAAAMQWYVNENPKATSQSSFEKATKVLGGIARFFSDQSYVEGLRSFLDFTTGDLGASGVQSVFSSTAGQLVPLSSLQRLVSHVIDPVYRKPEAKFDLEAFLQSVQKDIPFLSRGVPEIEGSDSRQKPLINALSPLNITDVKTRDERELQRIRRKQEREARIKAHRER